MPPAPGPATSSRASSASTSGRHLRLVKGSHIVVNRLYEGDHAFILQNADRRIVFTIPYEGSFTLVGTTDVPYRRRSGEGRDLGRRDALSLRRREPLFRADRSRRPMWSGPIPACGRCSTKAAANPPPPCRATTCSSSRTTAARRRCSTCSAARSPPFAGSPSMRCRSSSRSFPRRAATGPRRSTARAATSPTPISSAFAAEQARRYAWLPPAPVRRLARAYGTRIGRVLGEARVASADLGRHFGGDLYRARGRLPGRPGMGAHRRGHPLAALQAGAAHKTRRARGAGSAAAGRDEYVGNGRRRALGDTSQW